MHPAVGLGGLKLSFMGGRSIFDSVDFIYSNILMPTSGLLIIILLGYIVDKKIIKNQIKKGGYQKI